MDKSDQTNQIIGNHSQPNLLTTLDLQTSLNINKAITDADPPLTVNYVYTLRTHALAFQRNSYNKLAHTGPPPSSEEIKTLSEEQKAQLKTLTSDMQNNAAGNVRTPNSPQLSKRSVEYCLRVSRTMSSTRSP
jgi:hypothetical protein